MRILNLISSVDPAQGGVIEAVRQLQIEVEKLGHSWEVASLDAPDAPWVASSPLRVHALGPGKSAYIFAPDFHRALGKLLPAYDVALVHGLWQYHAFGGWRALRRAKMPYGVYPHGMLDPYFKRNFPLKHLKKLMFWPWSDFRVLRDASAVCFTCEGERVLARQSFRFYRAREEVVGLGTSQPSEDPDDARNSFFARFPELKNQRFLLFLARLHPKKGLDLLLEAFAQTDLPADWKLVIAGPDAGNWRAQLEEKYVSDDLKSRIIWTGMIAGDEKWGAFHAAEAFILPSHQENFGIAVAEALARGLPVLISHQVNIWREIEASGAGLVADDTLEGTAQLLSRWAALPQTERDAMKSRAKACFNAHFDIAGSARKLVACLENFERERGQVGDAAPSPSEARASGRGSG
ncbi:MAG TPA: glycosyltransferase [Abditibacterium sp.]